MGPGDHGYLWNHLDCSIPFDWMLKAYELGLGF